MNNNCVFCDIVNHKIEANMIYENHLIACFLDIDPINEGHILIIPKSHFSDVDNLSDEVVCEIVRASQRILRALKGSYKFPGYSIMQNGGEFCDFGHYHMHIFPRYHGDGFGWTFGKGNPKLCNEIVAQKIKDNLIT